LGSGSYFICIPNHYLTERDEKEGTILIYPKGSECITLRFDVLSFKSKNGAPDKTGFDYVLDDSKRKNKEIIIENELAISYSENKAIED
jgi:hypothetical protein